MKVPMATTYENVDFYLLINTKYSLYQNYYFGVKASAISSLDNLGIYRGAYQNFNTIT